MRREVRMASKRQAYFDNFSNLAIAENERVLRQLFKLSDCGKLILVLTSHAI